MIIKSLAIVLAKFFMIFILTSFPTPATTPTNNSDHITLLTYNIHRGRDSNNKYTLNQMIQFINESNADVICLQEVLSSQSIKIGLATETYSYFEPNVVTPISAYGLGIYSKYPIIESNHVRLTSSNEKIGFLHAVLKVDNEKKLNVINVHLGLNSYERNIQISEILDYVNKLDGETVVLGDFNQTNVYLENLVDVAQHHNLENIHSYSALDARIDYIFITDNKVYCSHYSVLEIDLSDHYPVLGKIK